MTQQKETVSSFINKILNGTAIAIVVALIPNAILATVMKQLPNVPAVVEFSRILFVFQFFTPIMAGFLIAQQFKFTPMQQIAVGGAAYIGSGAWQFATVMINEKATGIYQLKGIGDLINMMITVAIAVKVIQLIGHKFGSLNIILLPILIGTGVGYIGWLLLPYVSYITTMIGQGINTFTVLQPILMSILIATSFAIIIVSPISTVAIGLAIGLNGLSAGAASMGIAATTAVLVLGTMRVNKVGVPVAIGLGAMKMMMPNVMRKPQMLIPMILTAIVSALSVPLLNLVGTPASSGFGLVGLVGPLASLQGGVNPIVMFVAWIVVPLIVGFFAHYVCKNMLKLYTDEAFKFEE
ncbi:MAG: PTS transporter subunit IIC [Culicoidibacterales bacterium]